MHVVCGIILSHAFVVLPQNQRLIPIPLIPYGGFSMPETGVIQISLEEEMKTAYLDYAMSVIIGRALPDVRDGLKPVHRRVLYAMYREGLLPGRKYAKCARVVGEVIGKYHPHGDSAVYDTLVRMAQDFNMRYPLVDGQGNFGSVDGDPPAAYRYTEARLAPIALELIEDLDKETVDFIPNFDETLMEPVVFPARLPNLILNGAEGIAVGMSTHIPPHNLTEVCDALMYLIDHPNASVRDLMRWIKGPDFPTGGIVFTEDQIRKAYETGRGIIRIRARIEIESLKKKGREQLVVTEIPYQTNKADIIEEIARLVHSKKIQGIQTIRDESNRQGIRVVIELKKGENPDVVMNQLYQHTRLQISYGIQMLAIQNLRPTLLNLKQLLEAHIAHRREVILRRTAHELRQAKHREHILEGIIRALDHIDAIIDLIRASKTVDEARKNLMERFNFTQIQAQAILDMRLQRLTGMEREKLENELNELRKRIAELESILHDPAKVSTMIKNDLRELKKKYGDKRRTEILGRIKTLREEDLIREEEVIITVTKSGYIKRTNAKAYSVQKRGGKGRSGITLRDEDALHTILYATTLDYLVFFFNDGRVYSLRAYQLPEMGINTRGRSLVNYLSLKEGEQFAFVLRIPYQDVDNYDSLVIFTRKGLIKRLSVKALENIPRNGRRLIRLRSGDALIGGGLANKDDFIFIVAESGRGVIFPVGRVRPQGREGTGIRGIRLREGENVSAFAILRKSTKHILLVTEGGYGKRLVLKNVPLRNRGARGVYVFRIRKRTGKVVCVEGLEANEKIMLATRTGMTIFFMSQNVSVQGRPASGVRVMSLDENDAVVSLTKLP